MFQGADPDDYRHIGETMRGYWGHLPAPGVRTSQTF